jgi:anti-anti-sigma factor
VDTASPCPEWDFHVLLLYRDEPHRQDSVASWVQRGLERGEKIVYTHAPSDSVLLSNLAERGVDVDMAMRVGQLTLLTTEEFYPAGDHRPLIESALAEGYPAVRLTARADAALRFLREEDHLALELLMDGLCATLPVSAMCQYDATGTTSARLAAVIERHPDAVDYAGLQLRRRGQVMAVAGEVDHASAPMVTESLRRVCSLLEEWSVLTIDTSRWSFVDVAGFRAVAAGTDAFRRGGGGVRLSGLRPHMRKVLTLAGVPRLDGVLLDEGN